MKPDLKAAWRTTQLFLLVIGAACVVAFFRSLHTFYAIAFSAAALAAWYSVYFVLARMRFRKLSPATRVDCPRASVSDCRQGAPRPRTEAPKLNRWLLRTLRYALDAADDRLHAREIQLQTSNLDLPGLPTVIRSEAKREPAWNLKGTPARVPFSEWEARRAGVLPAARPRRARHISAEEFDQRFA